MLMTMGWTRSWSFGPVEGDESEGEGKAESAASRAADAGSRTRAKPK